MRATTVAALSVLLLVSLVFAQATTDSGDSLELRDGENIHDESIESISEESDDGLDFADDDDDSDDEGDSVVDASNLSEEEIAQLQEEFKFYGNYCGPGYCGGQNVQEQSGRCRWSVRPIDSLDACCKLHDQCCGSSRTRGKSCNRQILACATNARCTQSNLMSRADCELKKVAVKVSFAALQNQICGDIMDKFT
jgi:hypothetical protein